MRFRYVPVVLVMAIAACATRPIARDAAPARLPAQATTVGSIHARAIYLERIAMPAGATLELQLLGEQDGGPASDVVSRQSFGRLQGPPYDVELAYDAGRIRAGTRYSLRAALRDADGHLEFATGARVPVVPGDAAVVELRLSRVGPR